MWPNLVNLVVDRWNCYVCGLKLDHTISKIYGLLLQIVLLTDRQYLPTKVLMTQLRGFGLIVFLCYHYWLQLMYPRLKICYDRFHKYKIRICTFKTIQIYRRDLSIAIPIFPPTRIWTNRRESKSSPTFYN